MHGLPHLAVKSTSAANLPSNAVAQPGEGPKMKASLTRIPKLAISFPDPFAPQETPPLGQ